jgi:hypothetical protein
LNGAAVGRVEELIMVHLEEEPNAGKAWTQNDLSTLKRLAAERVPTREIADRLGRSEYSVRSKARLERISLQSAHPRHAKPAVMRKPR